MKKINIPSVKQLSCKQSVTENTSIKYKQRQKNFQWKVSILLIMWCITFIYISNSILFCDNCYIMYKKEENEEKKLIL